VRRFILTALAALGVAAALSVTASSTAEQAHVATMTGIAVAGLVVLLEVINVSGTWVWLTDKRWYARVEAAIGVGGASLVTGWCGALSYGVIGLVAPIGLLFAVHQTYRLNQPAPRVLAQRLRIVPARPRDATTEQLAEAHRDLAAAQAQNAVATEQLAAARRAEADWVARLQTQDTVQLAESWGRPPAPTPEERAPRPPERTPKRPLRSVDNRTRAELEKAGEPLGVKRREGERVADLRARVAAAEQEARQQRVADAPP
jgi:hypothetical protein